MSNSSIGADEKALEWCENNPGWKRICDIEDSSKLYMTWEELSEKEKKPWIQDFGKVAKEAWEEFAIRTCKVPIGFITGKGEFYDHVLKVPLEDEIMQVFKLE